MSRSGLGPAVILFVSLLTRPFLAAGMAHFVLELPAPNGPYAVGTKTLVLSDARRNRDLLITTWFPASGESVVAPYMDKRTAAELSADWKLQPGFEQNVHTHGWLQSPIAPNGPFPLVLLEHGSGVVPAVYTILAEGLASNGFIVVATNHPPDSLIAAFPDGREVRAKPYWPEDADRRTQGAAIGKFAEDVLVADVRFVLDRFQDMNVTDPFWHGRIDLSKVGIVGHSMGGTTAALATREESRISAGVNLDGSTFPGMNADVRPIDLRKPLLFMATEEHASNPETHAREYIGSESNTYYVVVAGDDHMGFTDAPLLMSRFSREYPPNDLAYEQALLKVELTRFLVEEFLAKYLKHSLAPELDALVRVDRR